MDSVIVALETQKVALQREVRRIERKIFDHLVSFEAQEIEFKIPWFKILAVAHGTGLDHETIRLRFNCALHTYQRWCEGKASPSGALRIKLIDVLRAEMDLIDG